MQISPHDSSVRLKVSYKTPEALIDEYTRSVGQGSVTLETRRSLTRGTRFVFEMQAEGVEQSVEVVGEVVHITPRPGGRYHLTVKYATGVDRAALDAVLQRIFAQEHEKLRRYPRVPLNVRAIEATPFSPAFYVRDMSRGGVGMEVDAQALPNMVKVGTRFLLEMELAPGPLLLPGEVVWTSTAFRAHSPVTPIFGVAFHEHLPADTASRLEALLALEALPPGPWWARVSFGQEALTRVP
jgi:Tfp pilus assembly protein PilZ